MGSRTHTGDGEMKHERYKTEPGQGQVQHYWDRKPTWFDRLPLRLKAALALALTLFVCLGSRALVLDINQNENVGMYQGGISEDPSTWNAERARREFWEKHNDNDSGGGFDMGIWADAMVKAFFISMFVVLVAVAVYLSVRLFIGAWKVWKLATIEVNTARVVPKADNGHLHVSEDGTISDIEASPSRRTTKRGVQPEPETEGQRDAIHNLRMIEAIRAAGGRAAVEFDQERREPPFEIVDGGSQKWSRLLDDGLE